jgi:hypothetical protein
VAADFLDYLEVEIVRALRCVDRAGMIAQHLKEHPVENLRSPTEERLREDVRRALAIRESIMAAGIELPPLRAVEQRSDEPPAKLTPRAELQELTIPQIAELGGRNRSVIKSRLQRMEGPIGKKYAEARWQGKPARFSIEEAEKILAGGGKE